MGLLFLVDGAFGKSKSCLIAAVKATESSVFITKSVTLDDPANIGWIRNDLSPDLNYMEKDAFEEEISGGYHYQYSLEGIKYASPKDVIAKNITMVKSLFVTVRSIDRIKDIKRHFSSHKVITVYIYIDDASLKEQLFREGLDQKEIDFRLKRYYVARDQFAYQRDNFDHTIVYGNDFDSEFHAQIKWMISKELRNA